MNVSWKSVEALKQFNYSNVDGKNNMKKRQVQNTAVIAAALGATILAVYANTNWLSSNHTTGERERCYNVVRTGKNDCGNAKHACASQATIDADPEEFIMVPKGLCQRIVGGKGA
jgi:uncharacterized membrane protein